MTAAATEPAVRPVLSARGLVKRYGHITALDGADFDLLPGEVLAVVGDNGAGKSTLIKALTGAIQPDAGEILLDGRPVRFRSPIDARRAGIETVYQDLAVAPALDIAENLFLGREVRRRGLLGTVFRMLDKKGMREQASRHMGELRIGLRSLTQAVETLSGGQRQGVAVARAAAWARHVVIMDEPTAALGVKESGQVLDLIRRVRDRGLPVVLISHNMPQVFEIADRIHVQRLGRRVAVVDPREREMSEVVAIMTGALRVDEAHPGRTVVVDAAAAEAAKVGSGGDQAAVGGRYGGRDARRGPEGGGPGGGERP
jgi:ABC-type sugar transport system, ATPase component